MHLNSLCCVVSLLAALATPSPTQAAELASKKLGYGFTPGLVAGKD